MSEIRTLIRHLPMFLDSVNNPATDLKEFNASFTWLTSDRTALSLSVILLIKSEFAIFPIVLVHMLERAFIELSHNLTVFWVVASTDLVSTLESTFTCSLTGIDLFLQSLEVCVDVLL